VYKKPDTKLRPSKITMLHYITSFAKKYNKVDKARLKYEIKYDLYKFAQK